MGKEKEHPKPLSKKEWEFWEDRLGFFIQEFDDNIGHIARGAIDAGGGNNNDHFLSGMVQGMWAVYNFVETRMVKGSEEEKTKKIVEGDTPKRKYRKSGKYKKGITKTPSGGYIASKEKKRVMSDHHKEKIKEGINRYWRDRRKFERKIKVKNSEGIVKRKLKGRKSNTITSMDVVGILKGEPKREFGSKEIFERLVGQGKIPRTRERKRFMKVLCDRLYFLQSKGVIKKVKKGKKPYYRYR